MNQILNEESVNLLATAIARAARAETEQIAEARRLLGAAIANTINSPAFCALYQQLSAPLVALMTGPLADLAAALARESRRRAGAEREANSKAIQLLAHTQRGKGNGR